MGICVKEVFIQTSASPSAGWAIFLEERQGPLSGHSQIILHIPSAWFQRSSFSYVKFLSLSLLGSQSILHLFLGPCPNSTLQFIWVMICSASSSLESRLLKERPGLLLLSTAVSRLSPGPVPTCCPTNRDWISTGVESEGSAWEGIGSSYLIP